MEWKYGDITSRIIAASMEIHRELGPGFPEYVYRRALQIEFQEAGVNAHPSIAWLINFGAPSLQFKRLLNRRFHPDRKKS